MPSILARKNSEKISVLTCYDFSMAKLLDTAGVDILLVGDSLACVVQGHRNTLPCTLDEMIYHCKNVARAQTNALVVGDMPFMSYQVSIEQALLSAGKMIKDGGVSAVKLEGGQNVADRISALVKFDIPVMGHIGLTPQSYHRMGGHKMQGRSKGKQPGSRESLIADAKALEQAGVFSMVLEGIPADLAAEITQSVSVPTIGIGAGPHCDGQVLVINDLLGMNPDFKPRFVKQYANLAQIVEESVRDYIAEVKNSSFPAKENYVESDLKAKTKLRRMK